MSFFSSLFDFHTLSSGNLRNERENSIIMKKTDSVAYEGGKFGGGEL